MDELVKAEDSLRTSRDPRLQHYYLQQELRLHLRDYWLIVLKHRWTVLACFAIIVTVVTIYTFNLTSTYRATATIKIDLERPQILSFQEIGSAPQPWYDPDFMGTQQKLLQSQSLAERVSKTIKASGQSLLPGQEVGAKAKPSVTAWPAGFFTHRTSKSAEPTETGSTEDRITSQEADSILGMLSIEPIRASHLVKISFTTPSPQLAALLANTWATSFIDYSLDIKYNATAKASEWLSSQLRDVLDKLQQSEAKLHEFAKQKEILTVGEKKDIITTKLSDLNDAMTKAQGDRIAKEALYRQTQGVGFDSIPAVLENPLISSLKSDYYKLDSEYRRLGETYKPGYPKMVRVRESMDQIRRQIEVEITRFVDAIKQEYEAAVKKEKLLQAAVNDQKVLAVKLNQDFIRYDILKREVDTNRQLYTSILERQKQAGVSQGLTASNIQLVDQARVPTAPFGPNRTRYILIGMILGLTVGVGMAFFFDYLDHTVKSPEDLERSLGIPSLALIPSFSGSHLRTAKRHAQADDGGGQNGESPFALIAHNDLRSIPTEAFRTLITSLLFSSPGSPPKSILFTSARPGEGKTSVSINTATALSQLGGSVLLIDGDMRRSSCHTHLQIEGKPGLSEYLTGNADLLSIIQATPIPRLYSIPAGTTPVNPTSLLASSRMKETIEILSQRFDYIVIDSPPIYGIADALILSTVVDGVVLVVHGGRTPREMVRRTFKNLIELNATILGAVLNNVDIRQNGYPYYDYYHQYYQHHTDTAVLPADESVLSADAGEDRTTVEVRTPQENERMTRV